MKYVLIIPDGAADLPVADLGGKTPLAFAHTPNLDHLARIGRVGTVATTPEGMPCGSDVCSMSLIGYDPLRYHTGRAPLEAAALGIPLAASDWIFRVNLVTVIDGRMQDHSAGHISDEEAGELIADFVRTVGLPEHMELHPGVSYRNILVDRRGTRDWSELATTPPHDVPGEPMHKHLPIGGDHAALLQKMVIESEAFLAGHEVNLTRIEMGEAPATHLWPWGQGTRPSMPSFEQKYALRGAMITAVDLLAGIAAFIGWDRLEVPGQTSYHDTDYQAAGTYAIAALEHYDLVCVHIESPDEAGHAADPHTKVAAIAAIDEYVVGPVHRALQERYPDQHRLLVLPDHYTRVDNRKHDPTPVPFVMAGRQVQGLVERPFTEEAAAASDLRIRHGHELMDFFLKSGLS